MAGFLDSIEPLKQTALTELKAAPDLATLEQTKGAWTGPNGKFTALMKQLGTLSKEEKPAAGKLINATKVELEAALASRREELEMKAALPKEPTLAALMSLPAAGFSSFESVPSCFISAVNLPFGPIHAPLVCSSAARSGAALSSASAVCFNGSMSSRSGIKVGND